MRRGRSKKSAERIHAKRRIKQHYGLDLNRSKIRNIIAQIQNQQAHFICHESNRLTVWDVVIEGNTVTVVYDKERKMIVTAL